MEGHNFNFRIAIYSKAMVRYNRVRFCYNQYLKDALNIRSRLICDRGWRLDEIGFGRHSNWLSEIAPRRMGLMPDFDLACWDFSKAGCFLNDATSPPRRPTTRICLSWSFSRSIIFMFTCVLIFCVRFSVLNWVDPLWDDVDERVQFLGGGINIHFLWEMALLSLDFLV